MVPFFALHLPPTTTTTYLTMPMQVSGIYGSTRQPTPPDPPFNSFPNATAVLGPKDPFAHLTWEERRGRSKQMRKAQRPAWRR